MAIESPLAIILGMIITVITGTIETLAILVQGFWELLASLAYISSLSLLGLVVAIAIMAVVTFFMVKFFAGSGKLLIPLFMVGVVIIWLLILAAGS